MNKKVLIPTVLFLIILPVSIWALASEKSYKQSLATEQEKVDAKIVLYYSDVCTHCKIVEKYIIDNNIDSKVTFAQKNVRSNSENAKELMDKAISCNMETKTLGVPFLWDGEDGNKCIEGDTAIIEFFKNKANVK